MASITKLNNGKYKIVVTTYITDKISEDGKLQKKQKRICETYSPKATTPKAIEKEVNRYADELEASIHDGKYCNGEKMTFAKAVELWDEKYASISQNLTEGVLESYRDIIRNRFLPVLGNKKMNDIKVADLQAIIDDMQSEGRKLKSIQRTFSAVSSVFKYCYRLEIIEKNPIDRIQFPKNKNTGSIEEREKEESIQYFEIEEAKRFLKFLSQPYKTHVSAHDRILSSTGESYHVPDYEEIHTIPTQWAVYFNLAIYSGCRRGELIALTWEDIDYNNHIISINKATTKTKAHGQFVKPPKTRKSKRDLLLPQTCFNILHKWQLEEKELCLKLGSAWQGYRGKDFDKNYIFIQLDSGLNMYIDSPSQKFGKLIALYNETHPEEDALPQIRLHDLRHTSATILIASGCDIATVSKRLGHSDISTTLNVYTHSTKESDSQASDTLARLLG